MTNNALKISVNEVTVDTNITKDDIIAIAVSRYEQELLNKKDKLDAKIDSLRSEAKSKIKERDGYIRAIVNAKFVSVADNIVNAIAVAGIVAKYVIDWRFSPINEWNDPLVPNVSGLLSMTTPNSHYHFVTSEFNFDLSGESLRCQAEIDALDIKLNSAVTEMSQVRKDLSGLNTKERQIKAAFATKLLKNDVKGQALLECLLETDGELLKLDVM